MFWQYLLSFFVELDNSEESLYQTSTDRISKDMHYMKYVFCFDFGNEPLKTGVLYLVWGYTVNIITNFVCDTLVFIFRITNIPTV
jgi:hypothetical protein